MSDQFPSPLLKSIYATIESARAFVRERRANCHLHYRLREASETLSKMALIEESENPFWYSLYEGIIGRYVQLRTEYREMILENKKLRQENKELKERYWNAIKRLDASMQEVERL